MFTGAHTSSEEVRVVDQLAFLALASWNLRSAVELNWNDLPIVVSVP